MFGYCILKRDRRTKVYKVPHGFRPSQKAVTSMCSVIPVITRAMQVGTLAPGRVAQTSKVKGKGQS